jgi:hypothetical protein
VFRAPFREAAVRLESALDGRLHRQRAPLGDSPVTEDSPSRAGPTFTATSFHRSGIYREVFHWSHPEVVVVSDRADDRTAANAGLIFDGRRSRKFAHPSKCG